MLPAWSNGVVTGGKMPWIFIGTSNITPGTLQDQFHLHVAASIQRRLPAIRRNMPEPDGLIQADRRREHAVGLQQQPRRAGYSCRFDGCLQEPPPDAESLR